MLNKTSEKGGSCIVGWTENNLPILNGLIKLGAIAKVGSRSRWYEVKNRELIKEMLQNPPASTSEEWLMHTHTKQTFPLEYEPKVNLESVTRRLIQLAGDQKNPTMALLAVVKTLIKEIERLAERKG